MKKHRVLLSILALVLAFSMSIALASCSLFSRNGNNYDSQEEKELKADPAGQALSSLGDAFTGTAEAAYPTDVLKTVDRAASIKLSLDNDLLGGKYALDLVYDREAKKGYGNFEGNISGSDLSLELYLNENEIAVSLPTFLEDTYGVNLKTLAQDLEGSYMGEVLKQTGTDVNQVVALLSGLFDNSSFVSSQKEVSEKLKKDVIDYLNRQSKSISRQTFQLHDGSANGYNVTFELNAQNLVELINLVKEDVMPFVEESLNEIGKLAFTDSSQAPSEIRQAIGEINYGFDSLVSMIKYKIPNFKMTIGIGLKSFTREILCVDCAIYDDTTKSEPIATLLFDLGVNSTKSSKYVLTGNIKEAGKKREVGYDAATGQGVSVTEINELQINAEYLKVDSDNQLKRDFNVAFTLIENGTPEKYGMKVSFDHNKKTGDFDLSLVATDDNTGRTAFSCSLLGRLLVSKNSFKLSLDRLKIDRQTINIGFSIEVTTGAEVSVPNVPTYKNLCKLKEEEYIMLALQIYQKLR